MFPDAKWLDALKLPIRLKLAVAAACGALFYLFKSETITVGPLDGLVKALLLIGVVVFLIVVLFDALGWLVQPVAEKRRLSLLAKRRNAIRQEKDEQRERSRAAVLAQLDQLSRWEMKVIAEALEAGSPTFYHYVSSPAVTMLQAKRLVWSPGGPHHQDHYPFSIADFVWDELQKRRDEFLEKERALKAKEEADKLANRRRF